MLETLNRYIEDASQQAGFPRSLWVRATGDRRLARLFAASVVVHVIFYIAIIKLDSWAMSRIVKAGSREPEIVQIAELAPPPDRFKLRQAPEALERADLNRLQYDPDNPDDTHLLSRSPRPEQQRGSGGKLPSPEALEEHLQASHGTSPSNGTESRGQQPAPPATSPGEINRIPKSEPLVVAPVPVGQTIPVPPQPLPRPSSPAGSGASPEPATPGPSRGDNSESTAFGLQQAQGRYIAVVRAKIRKINEANMPREWIKDVLRNKVSAEFEIILRRGGRVASVELWRPSGYRVLDDAGRQAIYSASPFEGYPQNAGETILLTVTVYFFPLE